MLGRLGTIHALRLVSDTAADRSRVGAFAVGVHDGFRVINVILRGFLSRDGWMAARWLLAPRRCQHSQAGRLRYFGDEDEDDYQPQGISSSLRILAMASS